MGKNIVKAELSGEVFYFTPAAYKEWRLSLSTGDFHTHKATRVKRAPKNNPAIDLNTYLLDSMLPTLAEEAGLQYDGGGGENRLHAEMITTNSLDLSEDQYGVMEEAISKLEIKGRGFTVYAWNDSSGYDYWTVRQRENNYIQITAAITDPRKVDTKELKRAISKAHGYFVSWNIEYYPNKEVING